MRYRDTFVTEGYSDAVPVRYFRHHADQDRSSYDSKVLVSGTVMKRRTRDRYIHFQGRGCRIALWDNNL